MRTPEPTPGWEPDYQDYPAVVWNTVNSAVLRTLCQAVDGIPVQLGLEPDHPIYGFGQAIMIVLSSQTLQRLLDITPVTVGDDPGPREILHWRLGYLRRDAPRQAALRQRLTPAPAPLDARLQVEGPAGTVRVWAEPAPDGFFGREGPAGTALEGP